MARIEELEIEMQQLRIEVRFDTKIQYMIVLQSHRCLLSLKALYRRMSFIFEASKYSIYLRMNFI
jgi:hypothetical protein